MNPTRTTLRLRAGRPAAVVLVSALLLGSGEDRLAEPAVGPVDGEALVAAPVVAASAASTVDHDLVLVTGGPRGEGHRMLTGLACENGGDGSYVHYGYDAELPAGVFGALPAGLRLALDVHTDADLTQAPPASGGPSAWLQGTETTATVGNPRGTLVLRLQDGGGCNQATATLAGDRASTSGTWSVAQGTGAYRDATGEGVFSVEAGIGPGTDNPWQLDATGRVRILAPSLDASAARTFWGRGGLDYLDRVVTAVFELRNDGPGDAYGVQLTSASSPDSGVTRIGGGLPSRSVDLAAGETYRVAVRYRLGLVGPCALVLVGCEFDVDAELVGSDALDGPVQAHRTVHVRAPDVPPEEPGS